MYLGEFHQALQWYEEALKLRKEANAMPGIANSLTNIGRIQVMIGELDTAYQNIRQAIEIFQEVDSPIGHSYALSNLCELAIAEGTLTRLRSSAGQSIAIKEQQHDALGLQYSWALLSELRRLQGDAKAAEGYARQTLESGKATSGVNEQNPGPNSPGFGLAEWGAKRPRRWNCFPGSSRITGLSPITSIS